MGGHDRDPLALIAHFTHRSYMWRRCKRKIYKLIQATRAPGPGRPRAAKRHVRTMHPFTPCQDAIRCPGALGGPHGVGRLAAWNILDVTCNISMNIRYALSYS